MTKYDNIYEIYNTEQYAYEAFATAGVNSCKCVIRTAPCSIIVYEMHENDEMYQFVDMC